jgi:hypothetical protein
MEADIRRFPVSGSALAAGIDLFFNYRGFSFNGEPEA